MPQENVSFQQLFDQALSAQQQKNGDEALRLYQETLDKSQAEMNRPQMSVVFHNMSTLAFEKSDFLHAYVWSKKAVALDSGNRTAQQALEQYSKKFEVPQVAHQITTTQNVQKVIAQVPVDGLYVLSLIMLFLTLRLFFKNLILRRQRQIELVGHSPFAWKPIVSFIVLVLVIMATFIRWEGDQKLKGILIAEKTGVQTAAGENKSVIFEAQPGTEVEVLKIMDNYAQIRYPGAFSGWVPLKNLEVLSQ